MLGAHEQRPGAQGGAGSRDLRGFSKPQGPESTHWRAAGAGTAQGLQGEVYSPRPAGAAPATWELHQPASESCNSLTAWSPFCWELPSPPGVPGQLARAPEDSASPWELSWMVQTGVGPLPDTAHLPWDGAWHQVRA